METKLQDMFQKLTIQISSMMSQGRDTPSSSHSSGRNDSNTMGFPRHFRLKFPRYNGVDDPTSWLCCVEQYFAFHETSKADKIPLAVYHFDEDAQ